MQQTLTVFFSDIANSTRLYQERGDVVAHRLITNCLIELRRVVENHDGKLLRTVGDAVLASFESSDNAMLAAVESQRMQLLSPLRIRIGFHAGEVIPDSGDVYGNAVNVAARVAGFANASEIYTTEDTVYQLSPQMRKAATFLDHVDFKGIEQPLPVYRIQWQEESTQKPTEDTRIVTAVSRTSKYRSDMVLELSMGALTIRIDKDNPQIRIGREVDNDFVIRHESTSRYHASIELQRGRFLISDSSTNGTYLIRQGTNALFVRRESISLDSTGIIGAGWHPSASDAEQISYRFVQQMVET
ncbi:MAG: adenylate/guanylate cyclase domain-containing protein [Granulosicoccus sp.]